MLAAMATLLLCQLAGEAVVRLVGAPVPGPVVGMLLLAVLMLIRIRLPEGLYETADGLLRHLSLLFVPAGVGVVQHLDLFGAQGARVLAVVVLGTVVTLVVTALVFAGLARWLGVDELPDREGEP